MDDEKRFCFSLPVKRVESGEEEKSSCLYQVYQVALMLPLFVFVFFSSHLSNLCIMKFMDLFIIVYIIVFIYLFIGSSQVFIMLKHVKSVLWKWCKFLLNDKCVFKWIILFCCSMFDLHTFTVVWNQSICLSKNLIYPFIT